MRGQRKRELQLTLATETPAPKIPARSAIAQARGSHNTRNTSTKRNRASERFTQHQEYQHEAQSRKREVQTTPAIPARSASERFTQHQNTSTKRMSALAQTRDPAPLPLGRPVGHPLLHHQLRKDPRIFGVSLDQSFWIGAHAMQPFGPGLLHPHRSTALFTSQEIDRCTDAERHRSLNLQVMFVDPALLLGSPESDDQYIRFRQSDTSENVIALFGIILKSHWRTVDTNRADSWPTLFLSLIHI